MRFIFALFLLSALPAAADMRLALGDGEAFTYKVSWAILMGAGEIHITAKSDLTGTAPRLRVITTTATSGLARLLMRFDARAESVFDLRTGRLLSLTESSQQNRRHSEHVVAFDYAAKNALYSVPDDPAPPRSLALPPGDPMDLITSLVQTRFWDLKVGQKRDALVMFDDEFYELTIHAARMEKVYTSLGTFDALVLEPRMDHTEPKGMFRKGSTVRVWIEQDDERHLPVKFEVEFKIGTGVATLTAYQPPADSAATAVTKTAPQPVEVADEKPPAPDAKDSRP